MNSMKAFTWIIVAFFLPVLPAFASSYHKILQPVSRSLPVSVKVFDRIHLEAIIQKHGYKSLKVFPESLRDELLASVRNPLILLEEGRSLLLGNPSERYSKIFDVDMIGREQLKSIQMEIFWSRFHIRNPVMRRNLFEFFLKRDFNNHRDTLDFIERRVQFLRKEINDKELMTQFVNFLLEKNWSVKASELRKINILSYAIPQIRVLKNTGRIESGAMVNVYRLSFKYSNLDSLTLFLHYGVLGRPVPKKHSLHIYDAMLEESDSDTLGKIILKIWRKAQRLKMSSNISEDEKYFVTSVETILKRQIYEARTLRNDDKIYEIFNKAKDRDSLLARFIFDVEEEIESNGWIVPLVSRQ